jgi:hypothetical protein
LGDAGEDGRSVKLPAFRLYFLGWKQSPELNRLTAHTDLRPGILDSL